ncbi:MAG: transcriptional repressor LexA [Patescibacteria group bacterium]|nr:transcriptional repressor LexA [Patescibacteria group bacterium]
MPSYREIMKLTGLRSTNSVHRLINKLESAHMLRRDSARKIVPNNFFRAIPLLGYVEAGFPSPAEEELLDTVTLDEFLINNKEATYMLNVTGDSMLGAGILPGDIVLVERGKTAKDGDIVIAEVDGQWTMKYLRKRGGKIYLEAANAKYKPIIPRGELKVAAVVTSVIRKY